MNTDKSPSTPRMRRTPDIVKLSAHELSDKILRREVSCLEVMNAYLVHINAVNPAANAIVSLRDSSELLKAAEARDRELANGKYRGWMHGMPQAVKDLTLTAGILTTKGSPLLRNFIPTEDAIIVERIKREGAIIIGKTNTPEFGFGSQTYNPIFGVTRNAFDPRKTAGGSSGGAAVSLALRMLPVADGTDMMGSLRNPAAYNNVFGFRPSFGRVPGGNGQPNIFGEQLSVEGPMGRSVQDIAWLLSTQAGRDARCPFSISSNPDEFRGPLERQFTTRTHVGWVGDWNGYYAMEPGVLSLCEKAVQKFADIGCTVDLMTPNIDPRRLWMSWTCLRSWMTAGALRSQYDSPKARSQMKPEVVWEIECGLKLTAADVYNAEVIRTTWYRELLDIFRRYDFLILPSAQVFPFDASVHWPTSIAGRLMDTYHRWMEIVVPASLAGCPVLSVPAGFSADGLPMGMQVIGSYHADRALLEVGHAYERRISAWLERVPPLLQW